MNDTEQAYVILQHLSEFAPVAVFTGSEAKERSESWVAARDAEERWRGWSGFSAEPICLNPLPSEIPEEVVS